jgi:glycosyltransferase involved in cell wall biosynthesis
VKTWLVNPFDPLLGDPEQEGRYATLARLLAGRGHEVTWWTSTFSHRFKRPVDQAAIRAACEPIGLNVRFLSAPPYQKNVSLARLRNHRVLARGFAQAAFSETPSPDVVVASAPPPIRARAAVRFAHGVGARAIVDVQDLWPETFRRIAPVPLRPLADLCLWPSARVSRQAYAEADAIVGVAETYVERALALGGPKRVAETIPLGMDLKAFDQAARAGRAARFTKPPGEVWLIYAGSLNRSYDCLTILRAAAKLKDRLRTPWRLFMTSRGELRAEAERLIQHSGLGNVTLTGFLDFPTWAYLLSQCDIGFNAVFPEAFVFLPNKIFYYLAAGLAVLNTIPGQCSRIVREGGCGLDYPAGDAEACADAVERLVRQTEERSAMAAAARRLAETVYDRRVLYPGFAEMITQIGGLRRVGAMQAAKTSSSR